MKPRTRLSEGNRSLLAWKLVAETMLELVKGEAKKKLFVMMEKY